MKFTEKHKALIAAYHAGRLTPDEAADFERRVAADPHLAADVRSLAPVAQWLREGFEAGPSTDYRLSPERAALIRAAANGDIAVFPHRGRVLPAPSRASRAARRYGLAAAAAVVMVIGAMAGFQSGRFQFADTSRPILLAVDAPDSSATDEYAQSSNFYPPAYGLDHADLAAARLRGKADGEAGGVRNASEPHRDYGLPGPGSPYLRSREILFLQ